MRSMCEHSRAEGFGGNGDPAAVQMGAQFFDSTNDADFRGAFGDAQCGRDFGHALLLIESQEQSIPVAGSKAAHRIIQDRRDFPPHLVRIRLVGFAGRHGREPFVFVTPRPRPNGVGGRVARDLE